MTFGNAENAARQCRWTSVAVLMLVMTLPEIWNALFRFARIAAPDNAF